MKLLDPQSGFLRTLEQHGLSVLRREQVTTLQVNLGKLCNMACLHCHVEAGPTRTEQMEGKTVDRLIELLADAPGVELVDLTGGAPELNVHFTRFVQAARSLGRRVIDRCNLTVLFEPGQERTAEFLAENQVEVVASLPCYQRKNVEAQRGKGAFDKSIEGLKRLNALGYGQPNSKLQLNLVYNPGGPSLPPAQAELQEQYRTELQELFGVQFHQLLTLTNMPIKRFAHALERDGQLESYMKLLASNFNAATLPGLMCRNLVSVGWDGSLYDCDFNQMLELPLKMANRDVWKIRALSDVVGDRIATAGHCFGCTAGAGSSCSGALQ